MGVKESKSEKCIRPTSRVLLAILGCVVALGILILFLANQQRKEVGRSGIKTDREKIIGISEGKEMAKLNIGDKAPGFELLGQDLKTVKLSDFAGKKVLVYFYPKAGTPGCTAQACSVRDSAEPLKNAGIVALGISPDKPDTQKKFDEQYNLGFRLLSDPDHKVAWAYGVWGEKLVSGKKTMGIIRSSFLIDEEGKIIGVWYDVSPADTVPKALEALGK
jgi:peroxiredoxin Q/BCP